MLLNKTFVWLWKYNNKTTKMLYENPNAKHKLNTNKIANQVF